MSSRIYVLFGASESLTRLASIVRKDRVVRKSECEVARGFRLDSASSPSQRISESSEYLRVNSAPVKEPAIFASQRVLQVDPRRFRVTQALFANHLVKVYALVRPSPDIPGFDAPREYAAQVQVDSESMHIADITVDSEPTQVFANHLLRTSCLVNPALESGKALVGKTIAGYPGLCERVSSEKSTYEIVEIRVGDGDSRMPTDGPVQPGGVRLDAVVGGWWLRYDERGRMGATRKKSDGKEQQAPTYAEVGSRAEPRAERRIKLKSTPISSSSTRVLLSRGKLVEIQAQVQTPERIQTNERVVYPSRQVG
ncbi:hypothetical protein C8R44DRAFT_728152 [Mycena epipterygia]|nr:hypothetical protein C8R44DRAFT_728152 [Mycena epipterygia]